MGLTVGLGVGEALGDRDGEPVGETVGARVLSQHQKYVRETAFGQHVPKVSPSAAHRACDRQLLVCVGEAVGDALGEADGDALGEMDGDADGEMVGLDEGDADGPEPFTPAGHVDAGLLMRM